MITQKLCISVKGVIWDIIPELERKGRRIMSSRPAWATKTDAVKEKEEREGGKEDKKDEMTSK